jgi:hypothetical protein
MKRVKPWKKKREPIDVLYDRIVRFVEKQGWKMMVIGPSVIRTTGKFRHEFVVEFTGKKLEQRGTSL